MRFIRKFWQRSEEGYDLIYDLVNANQFDSFASQYCFYLGEIERDCNECHDAYIEIVWDYKTYFETLSMGQVIDKVENDASSDNLSVGTLKDAKQNQIRQQMEELAAFAGKVAEYRNATSSDGVLKLTLNGNENI